MQNQLLQRFTNSLLVSSFLLSALGQVGRVSLTASIHFYLYEPLFVLVMVLLVLQLRLLPFQKLWLMQLSYTSVYFLLWVAFTLVISLHQFNTTQNAIAVLYFIRLALYIAVFPYMLYWVLQKRIQKKLLLTGIWCYCIFLFFSAAVQYIYYPNLRNLAYAGWDPHYFRVFGTYFEPVVFATIAGLFGLYFILQKSLWKFVPIVLSLIAIVASFSRAVYVGVLVSTAVLFRQRVPWKLVLASVAFIVAIFFLIPKPAGEGVNILRTSTIESRKEDYMQGVQQFLQHPVVGIGYNHIGAVKKLPQSQSSAQLSTTNNAAASFHASLLILLVTAGIFGLLFYAQWLVQLMKISKYFAVAGVFLITVSFFDNMLLHPFVLFTYLFIGSTTLSDTSP